MNSDEIAKAAAQMAAIIGRKPPPLKTEQDLIAYCEEVEMDAAFIAWGAREELDCVRAEVDPEEWKRSHAEARERANRRMNRQAGLIEGRERAKQARKRQGEETRARVKAAQRVFADQPKREQAALIAKRLAMPLRTVR